MNKPYSLVILDRDGVINEDSDAFVKSLGEWIPLPGSIEAIARLSRAGIRVFVATNQSGIARGLFTLETLAAMHTHLQQLVAEQGGHIEGIEYCPHGPDEGCNCRKPAPGMVQTILAQTGVAAHKVLVIGDNLRDLQAGKACGCDVALVLTGKGRGTLKKHPELAQGRVSDTLTDLVSQLLPA